MSEKTESERQRAEVSRLRVERGYKLTRHLTLAEGREFIASGKVPATALGRKTFVKAKYLQALPSGSTCLCCGEDLSGQAGWVVEIATPAGQVFKTVCIADYETIDGAKAESETESDGQAEETIEAETPLASLAPTAASASADPVAAALKALTAAVAAKSAPPKPAVDEAKLVGEAVKAAKDAAKDTARDFMQKTLAEFLRDGTTPSADGAEEKKPRPKAKGDGVDAAEKATSWSAKATAQAKDAVEKLNKFLSEFSYFRAGVSMRLVNTFARAGDRKAALLAYCEVSQMEDLPDLVEKMKSPEFGAVCTAFDEAIAASPGKSKPKPLNRRFAVFYGSPGGGKTYAAIKAGESINGGDCDVVPCSPSMDAADMLYAYRLDYRTGKRGYVPTALLDAMVNGRAVVLDEINLLPMEARMFLQNVLDNKGKVNVMGVEIPISDGFFVLGTMNLETGLGSTPLPLPLVDRAAVVREFKTTTSQAAVGAGLC